MSQIFSCVKMQHLRHAKICFLWEESLLKQAGGVVYKDVLQGRQGWPFLPLPNPPSNAFSFRSAIGSLTARKQVPVWFWNPDSRIIRIASGASWSLVQRLFQMKNWQQTDNPLIHRPHFTRALLPEKSIFLALSAEIGKLCTDLLLWISHFTTISDRFLIFISFPAMTVVQSQPRVRRKCDETASTTRSTSLETSSPYQPLQGVIFILIMVLPWSW